MTGIDIIAVIATVIAVGFVVFMLIKKFDARLALFASGLGLLMVAALIGRLNLEKGTGIAILNPFMMVPQTFVNYIGGAGIIIMLLFGYSSYMSTIGANDVTVKVLTKPLLKVKSPYVLVILMLFVGNLLSVVVPSASSLAIILMATLFPVLQKSGVSSLTAVAIIATSASIMPTPLGADNVAIATELGLDVMTYTFGRHALVSIPGIFIMAISHFYWQRYMDKKSGQTPKMNVETSQLKGIREDLPPSIYMILPLFPIILLIASFVAKELMGINIKLTVSTVTIISLILAIIFEAIRHKSIVKATDNIKIFFKGMGEGFTNVVTLVVGATLFVEGLKAVGVITMLTEMAKGVQSAGIVVMFIFVFFILLIGLLSGSGNAAVYALIGLVPALTVAVDIPAYMVTVPMQMASNLVRGLTPVSAVVVIVSSMIKESPINVVKRTAVPCLITMVSTMLLSILLFFVLGI